jgi:hypothetical protein
LVNLINRQGAATVRSDLKGIGLTSGAASAVTHLVSSSRMTRSSSLFIHPLLTCTAPTLRAFLAQKLGHPSPSAELPFQFDFVSRDEQIAQYCDEVLLPRYELFRRNAADKAVYAVAFVYGQSGTVNRVCRATSSRRHAPTWPARATLLPVSSTYWSDARRC